MNLQCSSLLRGVNRAIRKVNTSCRAGELMEPTLYRLRGVLAVLVVLVAVLVIAATGGCPGHSSSCLQGTAACACAPGGICARQLTCSSTTNTCINPDDDNGAPPKNPICYTPCNQGYTDSIGAHFECSADGLMARCLDGARCVNGTCKATSGAALVQTTGTETTDTNTMLESIAALSLPGSCEANAQCPDYQVCIQGSCYSNCEYDSDCSADRKCYRKSCRTPCGASSVGGDCPAGTYCSIVDTENGYCMPLSEPVADAGLKTSPIGTYELSIETFSFTNSRVRQAFRLINRADRSLEFTITKLEHTEYSALGAKRVTTNPMPWMSIGPAGKSEKQNSFKVIVDGNGGEVELEINNGDPNLPVKWEGSLEVMSQDLGARKLTAGYAAGADGRWSGTAYYFAQFGDLNLDAWAADRDSDARLGSVGNAFIQRWGAFRRGRISLDEFEAVLTATSEATWSWPSVKETCPTAACYLYGNSEGFGRYSDSLDNQPIPSGVAQLPIAFDLKATDATHLDGRITSSHSLQYSANPSLHIEFSSDSSSCSSANSSACIAFLKSLDARIVVGGRYRTTSNDRNCSRAGAGFQLVSTPWLIPGFEYNTELDNSGTRYSFECRDTIQPFGGGDPKLLPVNLSLAQSNPIPDGASRRRRLELVDGALVNQDILYIIFRERFEESFLGATDLHGFSAYGVAVLKRSNAQLDASSYLGTDQTELRPSRVDLGAGVSCSDALIARAFGTKKPLSSATADSIATMLLDGVAQGDASAPIAAERVHYLCEDTGLFDEGAKTNGVAAQCPAGSKVTYFYFSDQSQEPGNWLALPCQKAGQCKNDLPSHDTQGSLGSDPTYSCPKPGACGDVLAQWVSDGVANSKPVARCKDANAINCDADRTHLKEQKDFLQAAPGRVAFNPLLPAIDDAFRYKTRFRNRQGKSIGFAPQVCAQDSNAIPYCYDPGAIDEIRERVNCLTSIYSSASAPNATLTLDPALRQRLKQYLTFNFSYRQVTVAGLSEPVVYDGFEKLNAELLVMLGDDAYTKAFQSRFDLASSALVSFEGSKLEPNGIDLAGVAGYEMYTLYQAAQYYQSALDRFYELSPWIWKSMSVGGPGNFVTQETVVSFFNRLMRASTQKSRAWSEVGKRYQSFNRPDLARFVAERAYTSAYLESIVLSRMMQSVVDVVKAEKRSQIRKAIDDGALTYRAALLDMRDVYAQFTDQTNNFGFAPDYIPFPALQPNGPNAFEALLATAKQATLVAAQKEDLAISANRSFETDTAAFQSELTQIRTTYENQLAAICGTFSGQDGRVYPAIQTYAYLDDRAKLLGDPCGLMGNGSLSDAMASLESVMLDITGISNAYSKVESLVQIERTRLSEQCKQDLALANYQWMQQDKVVSLQNEIDDTRLLVDGLGRRLELLKTVAMLSKCSAGTSTDCPTAGVAMGVFLGASVGLVATQDIGESAIQDKQAQIAEIQREETRWQTLHQCDVATIDSDAKVKEYLLTLKDIDLDALKTEYRLRLALSDIQRQHNQAMRLEAEEKESQQLSINVQAAKNDPNVRIYKNDAILNSDRTFEAAVQAAYQASKVFEYYTSQSYARLQNLALVRLVSHGDYSLEGYVAELEDEYSAFQETFGRPDTRVQILSLRDDILKIPRYAEDRHALSQSERVERFRQSLTDTRLLDAHGYVVVPFGTSLERVSPLTRNHKVLYMEAEVVGSDVGDNIGRVYIRQNGTGVTFTVDGNKNYFRFPSRTAVVNPFFNGVRAFAQEVYRNDRMRDRPLVNTHWEFVLNQQDEFANQDINLSALTDIRVFVYYTDFTGL